VQNSCAGSPDLCYSLNMGRHSKVSRRRGRTPYGPVVTRLVTAVSCLALGVGFTFLLLGGYDVLATVLALLGAFLILGSLTYLGGTE
jgi:hypothetical protein